MQISIVMEGRNGEDKLGPLRVCSCEIHFKIAALQASETSLDSMEYNHGVAKE